MAGPWDTVSGSRMRYVFVRGQERPTILKYVPGVGVETIPPRGHGESTITITDHDGARGINQTFYNLQRHIMGDTQASSRGATASAFTEAGTQESGGMKCPVCLESYLGIKGRGKAHWNYKSKSFCPDNLQACSCSPRCVVTCSVARVWTRAFAPMVSVPRVGRFCHVGPHTPCISENVPADYRILLYGNL